ncbi:sensor histidine kinase [Plebeiibacterium marinum]|uniref:histidine kinase n=1 Tax=Plebeiibacterium marinum TaxID=2992111 RepID=A0AAE3MBK8_9BACT|nr:HAMP domain-containing sensor histidine kinase [Plebeiobacterium marinum]MCW3804690.1 HAMP domain-containing histidine kinase [Plebeiobacterium marinum]
MHLPLISTLERWISIKIRRINTQETFHYILFFCIVISIFSTISNLILGLSYKLTLFTGASLLLNCLLLYLSHFKNKYHFAKRAFIIYIFAALNFLWLTNGGSNGPTLFVLQAFIPLFLFFIEIKRKSLLIIAFSTNLLALFTLEYYMPQTIIPYKSTFDRFLDLYLVSMLFFLIEVPLLYLIQKQFIAQTMNKINSERVKSGFLENMSHEVRTPMNAIIGFSELLKNCEDDAQTKEFYFKIIKENGDSLLKLMNNIITATQLEAGLIEPNKKTTLIKPLIVRLFNSFSNQLPPNKNIVLSYEINCNENLEVFTDELLLHQALSNLISNAIKYTQQGEVKFGIAHCHKNKNNIKIFVRDTGPGITSEKQKMIFKKFNTISFKLNNKKDGVGLSLSISYDLIKKLNGTIIINSEVGKGTEFLVSIPKKIKAKSKPSKKISCLN